MKVDKPLAKHVPLVLTALPVPPVVYLMPTIVHQGPTPMGSVFSVLRACTTTRRIDQSVGVVHQASTKMKLGKHRVKIAESLKLVQARPAPSTKYMGNAHMVGVEMMLVGTTLVQLQSVVRHPN